jgi:beta-1,3-glucuronyltransferase
MAFFDSWPAKRKWAVDMAGFAVNLNYLAKYPNATMPYKAGYEEDAFLRSIDLKIEDIEPKANECTEVYVWHTQTTKTKAPTVRISRDVLESTHTNLHALMKLLDEIGVSHTSSTGGEFGAIYSKCVTISTIYSWVFINILINFFQLILGVKATVSKDGNSKSLAFWARSH